MKIDIEGKLIWKKTYDTTGSPEYHRLYYDRVVELSDGSILMAGKTSNKETSNIDLILTKTDRTGNILWNRIYKSRFWERGSGSPDYYYIQQLKQDPNSGDVYLVGSFWSDGIGIVKIDVSKGDIIWSTAYKQGDIFDRCFGIDIRSNDIVLFGTSLQYGDSWLNIFQLNKANGSQLGMQRYVSTDPNGVKTQIVGPEPLVKMPNGHYLISGTAYGYAEYLQNNGEANYHASYIELDNNLRPIIGFCLRSNAISNFNNTKITVWPDGTGFFTMLGYISGFNADIHTVQFKGAQILRERLKQYRGVGFPLEPGAIKLPDGGDMIIRLASDSISDDSYSYKLECVKFHLSDTSSNCLGYNLNTFFLHPFWYKEVGGTNNPIEKNIFEESQQKSIVEKDETLKRLPACFLVSYCDTLKLIAKDSLFCLSEEVKIIARKNSTCGSSVYWQFDSSAIKALVFINDSTTSFKFKKPWAGYLYGSVDGCTRITDSVYLRVLQSPDILDIGIDTTICSNSDFVINAGAGFAFYQWSDGTKDSILRVSKLGKYYVTAKDACGGNFSDTVIVRFCDSIKLSAVETTICQGESLELLAKRNTGCDKQVYWDLGIAPVEQKELQGDSLLTVRFSGNWSGYIYARIDACNGITDSVLVHVQEAPLKVELGKDTTICPDNRIMLNAHTGYIRYKWQDGSTDSLFSVTKSGIYFVEVEDACNRLFYDTIIVSPLTVLPLFAGGDRVKCNNDTVQLVATSGFSKYEWSSATNLVATSNVAIVNPSMDAVYFLKAEQAPGCYAFDTVNVSVKHSPQINLGSDISFCRGDSVYFDAGVGFVSYLWSNAQVSQKITASESGNYSVVATDIDGCTSQDTISIIGLYNPPILRLNKESFICAGTQKILDPGSFKTYLWQDGSTNRFFKTTGIGVYVVEVSNSNDCKAKDSVNIVQVLAPPSNFLPIDSTICNYEKRVIEPNMSFALYRWNSGERSQSIEIKEAGLYWLEVQTIQGCIGRDSINLVSKECIKGLFVPSAFTPNADGKNDRFRAMLFGDIISYHFYIYNRFGELVYTSTNAASPGWDGTFKGIVQSSGAFVWKVRYQLRNESVKEAKGSFILIQ